MSNASCLTCSSWGATPPQTVTEVVPDLQEVQFADSQDVEGSSC
ncbi:hypothetical protein [Nostoc sp.]